MNTFPDNNRSFADTALTDTIFSLIRTLLEPQAVIHIGAGTGQGNMHFWRQWNLPDALIIEADETRLTWAQKACESNPAWHVVNTVIGSREGEALFFQATNPDEDGLTAPDRLTQLWPNLRQTGQNTRTIQRLDELLKAPAYQSLTQAQNRWLIIDCFPALEIIQGATESLNHTDVICVRIIKEALNNTKADMDIQAITDFLAPLNYRQSAIIESNHPAVGHAVFTRNISVLRSELTTLSDDYSQLNKKLDEQNRLIQDRLATIQRLETERDNQAKTAAERQQQIEQLTQQRDEQGQHSQALQKQIEQIQTERDNQAKTAAERQQQIEQLTQQRD
ncbi:MAG: hypothetical protein IBX56_11945, partial [Methylomicrobium sp.]|nr:hypothetical protein [Methylomicrobium sp.]